MLTVQGACPGNVQATAAQVHKHKQQRQVLPCRNQRQRQVKRVYVLNAVSDKVRTLLQARVAARAKKVAGDV